MSLDQTNVTGDFYVDGQQVAAQVASYQLYVLPSKSHKIEVKNLSDLASNGIYRWKDTISSVYLTPAGTKSYLFRLQKQWLKGFLEITCQLINFPPQSGPYCQPVLNGNAVQPIAPGTKQQYTLDPATYSIVVTVGPTGIWEVKPYSTTHSVLGGQTSRVTASFTYIAPSTPTVPAAPKVCNCGGPDLDGKDFGTHASAQACFSYCVSQGYGDVFGLDRDNDGLACEANS